MIEITNLKKYYGNKKAVDDISFSVNKGEILGFLGPNGAGKSTTMNIITGYISMTSGQVTIDGHDILEEPMKAKRSVGYLPEQPPLYVDMTVSEYLNFVYELKKVREDRKTHIEGVMKSVGLMEVKERKIKNLSKGFRQRVGLAQALIGNPEVIILDEPTVGLDPNQIVEIRNMIKELKKEHTIILSTHILQEVSAVCDRVVIINGGKIAAVDTPANLSRMIQGRVIIELKAENALEELTEPIKAIEGVTGVTYKGAGAYHIEADSDVSREVSMLCAEKGCLVTEIKTEEMPLEEIFARLTSKKEEDTDESDI